MQAHLWWGTDLSKVCEAVARSNRAGAAGGAAGAVAEGVEHVSLGQAADVGQALAAAESTLQGIVPAIGGLFRYRLGSAMQNQGATQPQMHMLGGVVREHEQGAPPGGWRLSKAQASNLIALGIISGAMARAQAAAAQQA